MIIVNVHGNRTISIIAVFICLQLHGNGQDQILPILLITLYCKVVAKRLSLLWLTGKVFPKNFIVSWKFKIMEYSSGTVYAGNRQIFSIIFTQEVSVLWCMPARKYHALVTFFKKLLLPFIRCLLQSSRILILNEFCTAHGILLGIQLLPAKHDTLRFFTLRFLASVTSARRVFNLRISASTLRSYSSSFTIVLLNRTIIRPLTFSWHLGYGVIHFPSFW